MSFVAKMKFWIAMVALALVAVLTFVFLTFPVMADNGSKVDELERRAKELKRYSSGKDVKNEKWLEQAGKQIEEGEVDLEDVRSLLVERDALLERRFDDPDNPHIEPPLEPGRWKIVYKQNMLRLQDRLVEHVQRAGRSGGILPMVRFTKDDWPSEAVMHTEEKRYWVLEAIVDACCESNKDRMVVPILLSVSFQNAPEQVLQPSHRMDFDCLAFRLRVALEFEDIPLLLEELLERDLGVELTGISVERDVSQDVTQSVSTRVLRMREEGKEEEGLLRRPGAEPGAPPYREGGGVMPGAPFPGEMPQGMPGAPFPGEMPGVGIGGRMPGQAERSEDRVSKTLVGLTLTGYVPDYLQAEERERLSKTVAGRRTSPGVRFAPTGGPLGAP